MTLVGATQYKARPLSRAFFGVRPAPLCVQGVRTSVPPDSEIRLVRTRDAFILIVMKSKRVFGAGNFRPFEAVAQINDACGPGRRECACILDREMDLQIFVLIVGIDGSR